MNALLSCLAFALRLCLRGLLSLRYRLETTGLDALAASAAKDTRPLLILPSHVSLVDPLLLHSLLGRWNPRPLADARQVERPLVRHLVKLARPIVIPDVGASVGRKGAVQAVREGLALAARALTAGDSVLIFPAGRLTRDGQEQLGSNSGAHTLYAATAQQGTGCRVVLVRLRGLWGSSFSAAAQGGQQGQTRLFLPLLVRNVGRLLLNGLFFMPRRRVTMHFEEITLPAPEAGVQAFNTALEAFYDAEPQPVTVRPYYWWQSAEAARATVAAELAAAAANSTQSALMQTRDSHAVAVVARAHPETAAEVWGILREEAGLAPDAAISLESVLATDLGLDSLRVTTVALRLESLHQKSVQRMDLLITAGHCLLAALGLLEGPQSVPAPPDFWRAGFAEKNAPLPLTLPLTLPLSLSGTTAGHIPALFWQHVRLAPHQPCVAAPAMNGGGGAAVTALTRRQALTRALALAAYFRSAPATRHAVRLGIMLPASPAATLTWLAVMLAGKVPVFCNWTTGPANFKHCLALTEVPCVLTARALLTRLEDQGFDPAACSPEGTQWLCLEDVPAQMTLGHKLAALWGTLSNALGLPHPALHRVPDTAALLFTSGSETRPKAVPLSQANVLANCRDMAEVLSLRQSDSLLALLPPFHSLGLTGNMAVALALGVPTVFHPNPTEAALLCAITRQWQPSLTVAPPTFVDGMVQKAGDGDLRSLRLGFVGAEKCPLAVYAGFAAATGGGQLCEGYGVTECAPVVCVNRTDDIRPGTIGVALPSVQTAVVVEEDGEPVRLAEVGERGMLLVRGPNVFGGYLAMPAVMGETPPSPFVQWQGEAWYRSGDLVTADAGGHMTFAGRLGRFVKLGGEMLSLPQMESVLLAAFEERRGTVEGPLLAVECPKKSADGVHADEGDGADDGAAPELTLFCAVDVSREEANAALRAAGLSGLYSVRAVRRLEALPLLGSGKTDYRALASME